MTSTVPAGQFTVDPARSDVYVQLKPDEGTLLSGLSHEHVIVAERFDGEVRYGPEGCRVDVRVPVSGLVVDPPAKRKALGFEKDLSEKDIKKIDRNMRAKDQLWTDRYGEIRYQAERCRELEPGVLEISGKLTLRGVTLALSLPVKVDATADGLRARVDFERTHGDFGFSPYKAFLGTLKNADSLKFHVDIHARRRP